MFTATRWSAASCRERSLPVDWMMMATLCSAHGNLSGVGSRNTGMCELGDSEGRVVVADVQRSGPNLES